MQEQETISVEKEPMSAGRKKRRIKYIFVLPSAVTLLNSVFGFMSILYASRGPEIFLQVSRFRRMELSFFAASGYMILFSMLADMLDGQVARWSGSTSSFGGQLDSLSDAISFGVAPAFLMFKMMGAYFGVEGFARRFQTPLNIGTAFSGSTSWLIHLVERGLLFFAIVYVLCTVIRLARFNVENDEDISSHLNFVGLPSPAAAGVVVSLVIFREDFLPRIEERLPALFAFLMNITVWLLPFAVLASGILMVTRIRYPHAVNKLLRRKKTFLTFIMILFAGLFVVWNIQIVLFLGFWGFALTGLVRYFFGLIFRREADKAK